MMNDREREIARLKGQVEDAEIMLEKEQKGRAICGYMHFIEDCTAEIKKLREGGK